MTYHTLTGSYIVKPTTEPIFAELVTTVALDDDAAGLFVTLQQDAKDGMQKISLMHEEWPQVRAAINRLMRVCKGGR